MFISYILFAPCLHAVTPIELGSIPVNGDDGVTESPAVQTNFGFEVKAASKVMECGDSVTLIDSYTGIETPHTDWAVPYARGPVRVLYIASAESSLRNPLELEQRSDFEFTVLPIPFVCQGALTDNMTNYPTLHDYYDAKWDAAFTGDYDVIVMPNRWLFWHAGTTNVPFLDEAIATIEDKVAAGTGLLCLHDMYAWAALTLEKRDQFHGLSPITHGTGLMLTNVPSRNSATSAISESISFVGG